MASNQTPSPAGPIAQHLAKIQSNGHLAKAIQLSLANQSSPQKKKDTWIGFADKTLWDWLQLLLIPVLIAAGGAWFQIQQHNTDIQIAADQQQASTLKAYLDDMTDLMLNKGLRRSTPDDEVSIVARAKTLTTLRSLDPERKRALLQFLYEAKLVGASEFHGVQGPIYTPVFSLNDADLSDANLREIGLMGADLEGVTLSRANLEETGLQSVFLRSANLSNTSLMGAYLIKADLEDTNLSGARLSGADLSGADLMIATVTKEQLAQAKSLKDTVLPDGSTYPSKSYPIPNHTEPSGP